MRNSRSLSSTVLGTAGHCQVTDARQRAQAFVRLCSTPIIGGDSHRRLACYTAKSEAGVSLRLNVSHLEKNGAP
jgi:hypothetical protein